MPFRLRIMPINDYCYARPVSSCAFSGGGIRVSNVRSGSGGYFCSICRTSYSTKGTLKIHYDTVHGEAEYYQCTLCEQVIKHKVYFRKHISMKHFKGGSDLVKNYGRRMTSSEI